MAVTVKVVNGEFEHEIHEDTQEFYVTKCELTVKKSLNLLLSDDGHVSCKKCRDADIPKAQVLRVTREIKWGAKARNKFREDSESLQFAHKAIVAALEWQSRGDPGQFTNEMLDQANLAYRFLNEVLASHDRVDKIELTET